MRSNEFKRDVAKTLDPRAEKEGFKALTKRANDVKLAYSILGTREAVGRLMHDYQGFILGLQLNPTMKTKGLDSLGDVLHHAVNTSRLLKAKVPASQKKIKPKNTHTFLLTEIDRTSAEMLAVAFDTLSRVKVVPMTDEEITKAKAKLAKQQANAPKKAGKTDQLKPKAEHKFVKLVAHSLDVDKLKGTVQALLNAAYEFTWAVYNVPVAKVMERQIEKLKPEYPAGFFDPPQKKAAPAKAPKAAQEAAAATH